MGGLKDKKKKKKKKEKKRSDKNIQVGKKKGMRNKRGETKRK